MMPLATIMNATKLGKVDDELETEIAALVRQAIPSLSSAVDVGSHDILQKLGLTSMGAVGLMLAVEARFNLVVPDKDMLPENFRTVAAIAGLVRRLTGA